eukprot:COSAG01_NODE_10101_length_2251_cov_1.611059_2_plen_166_part_00
MLTEIYVCHACSCHELLRAETAGQVFQFHRRPRHRAPALVRQPVVAAAAVRSGAEGGSARRVGMEERHGGLQHAQRGAVHAGAVGGHGRRPAPAFWLPARCDRGEISDNQVCLTMTGPKPRQGWQCRSRQTEATLSSTSMMPHMHISPNIILYYYYMKKAIFCLI